MGAPRKPPTGQLDIAGAPVNYARPPEHTPTERDRAGAWLGERVGQYGDAHRTGVISGALWVLAEAEAMDPSADGLSLSDRVEIELRRRYGDAHVERELALRTPRSPNT